MKILENENLINYSTYRTPAQATKIWQPESIAELVYLVKDFRQKDEKFWILGGGANTLFANDIIRQHLIHTSRLKTVEITGNNLFAEAGVVMDRLVQMSVKESLADFAKLSGIPGTVGGGLWMNAGAYGSEISDSLVDVTVIDANSELVTYDKSMCNFSYRSSGILKRKIIVSARWTSSTGDIEQLQYERKDILARRAEKQPLDYPSCGSVFKRPVGDYASRLLDAAGLKGIRVGGAEVSSKHAGFIINRDHATHQDIEELMQLCVARVKTTFGVDLTAEQQLCR